MKVKQIYHIGLPCNDLERAVKFYTEVLGMKCTKVGYDTESGGPYKDKYGMFPNIARLFMEDGMCLVLFQRPSTVAVAGFDWWADPLNSDNPTSSGSRPKSSSFPTTCRDATTTQHTARAARREICCRS